MTAMRPLRRLEREFIAAMLEDSPAGQAIEAGLADALVQPMDDGGMGSLRFVYPADPDQCYADTIAEAMAADEDGVPLSITLSVDQRGRPFELDVWKVDNSPLKRFPKPARRKRKSA
jgi:uncharacterized protein DUF6984